MKNRYVHAVFKTSVSDNTELEEIIRKQDDYFLPRHLSECYQQSAVTKLLWGKVHWLTTLAKIIYIINLVLGGYAGVFLLVTAIETELPALLLCIPISIGLFWCCGKIGAFMLNNRALNLITRIRILQHFLNADNLALYLASQKEATENPSTTEPMVAPAVESTNYSSMPTTTPLFRDSTEDDLNGMVFCEKCWKRVPPGNSFCPYCGASIKQAAARGKKENKSKLLHKRTRKSAESIITNAQGELICPHCFQKLQSKTSVYPHCAGKLHP